MTKTAMATKQKNRGQRLQATRQKTHTRFTGMITVSKIDSLTSFKPPMSSIPVVIESSYKKASENGAPSAHTIQRSTGFYNQVKLKNRLLDTAKLSKMQQ